MIALVTEWFAGRASKATGPARPRWANWISFGMLLNATLVHLMTGATSVSGEAYGRLVKSIGLFWMIGAAIRSRKDLHLVTLAIALGVGYIGYEATINDRGRVRSNRLEGIGAPGAADANHAAALVVAVMPMIAANAIEGGRWIRCAMLAIGPLVINVLILFNSRGGFLAAIAAAVGFVAVAPPTARRGVIAVVIAGSFAGWMLLGDERIVNRFVRTFSSENELDASALGRKTFWMAGIRMVRDYPLGAGGNAFKMVHGFDYIASTASDPRFVVARAVHNGFINEACEWGLQGAALRLVLLLGSIALMVRATWKTRFPDGASNIATACGLVSGMVGFVVTSMFGDVFDAEWGIWLAALACAHDRVSMRSDSENANREMLDEMGGEGARESVVTTA